jgi:GNAT superfamily N-acetyltransferase
MVTQLQESIGRLTLFAKRNGVPATLKRLAVGAKRVLTGESLVLFYCDLVCFHAGPPGVLTHGTIERKNSMAELALGTLDRLMISGYPPEVRRRLSERFGRGASLWLFHWEGQLAAYGWTLCGGTVEPHFFPLGANDVHLFDFFVFPEFRGRRINPSLVNHILHCLASEHRSRAFIETSQWNTAQLRSIRRMPFEQLGSAKKFQVFHRIVVHWSRESPVNGPASKPREPHL